MSIDTPPEAEHQPSSCSNRPQWGEGPIDWDDLTKRLGKARPKHVLAERFGEACSEGQIYCWGVATATGRPVDASWQTLARLACDEKPSRRDAKRFDWTTLSSEFVDAIARPPMPGKIAAAEAVVWAAALPGLTQFLKPDDWWRLLSTLQQLHESTLQQDHPYATSHLMLGGELGLTLAGCLSKLPHCRVLRQGSAKAVRNWCRSDLESLADAIQPLTDSRLVLASLIRSLAWMQWSKASKSAKRSKTKNSKKLPEVGEWLATWIAATTRPDGTAAFSSATHKAIRDDLPPEGLLHYAKQFDKESLAPAIDASLGKTPSGGRLAWEVSLPESMHHDLDVKLATMQCEWDIRRGKTVLDYSGEDVALEISAGKKLAIEGDWQTQIEVDEEEQVPSGPWSDVCEFSDDDVHYLELEQPWSGGILLQRQVLLLREDQTMLLADSVLVNPEDVSKGGIRYSSRLPLASHVETAGEDETREIYLVDKRPRVLVIPLAAGEWKVGPSHATLRVSEDHHLVLAATGKHRLYCPLWLDFSPRRFKRKRTWRSLTVGENLRLVRPDEAVAYRVQMGSEQWVMYRSLSGSACRTFLGKHMMADFFCARFDPSDGNQEDLITVDRPEDDE